MLACHHIQRQRFDLFPAIDLRGGRVVRLRQGDFDREQVYSEDPVTVAAGFAASGARWIHVVDLDGARSGEPRQAATVGAIVEAAPKQGTRIQVAGGLRTVAAISAALETGARRVVIGTAALSDPSVVDAALERHGAERVAVALDVRDGLAVGDGWVAGAPGQPVDTALQRLANRGVTTFAVTAIDRDGLLGGPDLGLLERCVGQTGAAILASGGIRSIADLQAVRAIGCAGAIVGRAIYDGGLDLGDALASLSAVD